MISLGKKWRVGFLLKFPKEPFFHEFQKEPFFAEKNRSLIIILITNIVCLVWWLALLIINQDICGSILRLRGFFVPFFLYEMLACRAMSSMPCLVFFFIFALICMGTLNRAIPLSVPSNPSVTSSKTQILLGGIFLLKIPFTFSISKMWTVFLIFRVKTGAGAPRLTAPAFTPKTVQGPHFTFKSLE